MNCPASLTLIRHGQAQYNDFRARKEALPRYREFMQQFDESFYEPGGTQVMKQDLHRDIPAQRWPTEEIVQMACAVHEEIRELMGGVNDRTMPLTELGVKESERLGKASRRSGIPKPDYICCSPYLRARQTMEAVLEQRDDLAGVPCSKDYDLREKEYGHATYYNDYRLFFVFNPQEALLYETDPHNYRCISGENNYDVQSRIRRALGYVRQAHSGKHVWWFTHQIPIVATRAELEEWDGDAFMLLNTINKPSNCGVTVYKNPAAKDKGGTDELVLEQYNKDVSVHEGMIGNDTLSMCDTRPLRRIVSALIRDSCAQEESLAAMPH